MTSDDRQRGELDPLLERVYRRGYRLRARRTRARIASTVAAVSVIATASVIGVAQVRSRDDGGAQVAIAPRAPGATALPQSPIASPTHTSAAADPTIEPSRKPSAKPSSCHNSTEETCGDFYWITKPGSNASVNVSIRVLTGEPVAGAPVTVEVTVSDPDAPNIEAWDTPKWGDPGSTAIGFALCLRPAYGGWDPPRKRSGTERFTYTHTYAEAGSYTFLIGGRSNSGVPWNNGCVVADPYGDEDTTSITIAVGTGNQQTPMPSPTSS